MKWIMSVLLAASLVLGGFMLVGPARSGEVFTDIITLTQSAPIRINGNADFAIEANGVANWDTGDGTEGNPWVIENLEINGTGAGYCIYVGNTTEHFVVRNCSLFGASGVLEWPYYYDTGLIIYSADNGMVSNNTILANNRLGIRLGYSDNSTLENNIVDSNNIYGILLDCSNGTIITNNSVSNNSFGIEMGFSEHNILAGNTMLNNGIFISGDKAQHWLTHTIDTNNTVGGNPVQYWKNQTAGTVPADAGQVMLVNCTGVTVENQNIINATVGISLIFSDMNTVTNCTATHNEAGIRIYESNWNVIRNSTACDNNRGFQLSFSGNNTLTENNASNNQRGISVYDYGNNTIARNTVSENTDCGIYILSFGENNVNSIYHNRIEDNINQAYDAGENIWHNGYPSGGNYWSDYNGADKNYDGIGDVAYVLDGNVDRYPLMAPWTVPLMGDFEAPFALNYTPLGNDVSASASVVITWNETMDWATVENAFSYTDGTTNRTSANGTWNHNSTTNVSVFTPAEPFLYETNYIVTMNSSATDIIGNMLDQNRDGTGGEWPADTLAWNFTTAIRDAIPPYALNYTPNATVEPVDVPITIAWNETMNWTSVEAAFEYTDGMTNWTSANGTWEHNSTTNVSVFTPAEPFLYETHYVVTVNSSAADIIGNMLDQNRNGTGGEWPADVLQWGFTTADEAPYVVSTQPADGQFDVDPHKPFKIVFSEAMNRTSVLAAFSYTDGNMTWNATYGSAYWNALHTEFTFSPEQPLASDTAFTATVNGTAADAGGKGLKDGNHTWQFSTWESPPAPMVASSYPPDGSFGVNVNTYINVAFDSEMDPASVETAFSYTDGITTWTADNGTVDWFSDNTLFSFQPGERLGFDTAYTASVNSSAMSIYGVTLDGNQNGVAEQFDNHTFSFTTTPEPPVVDSHYPIQGQTGMPTTLGAIYVNFSRVMLLNSVTSAVSISPTTPFTPSFSGGGRNLTMVLNADLVQATEYRVTVLGTASDLAGTKLDGNGDGWPGDRFTFTFYTEGIVVPEGPRILAIFPPNNTTIPTEAGSFYVAVSFNNVMNRTSVESAFRFGNASGEAEGAFTWSANNKAFRFQPSGNLAPNMTYTATLAGTARDSDGLTLGNATSWQYTTESLAEERSVLDWVLYGLIIALLALCTILYMANRSLRMELKRTRVKMKKLKRQAGIVDGEPTPESTPGAEEPEPDMVEEPEPKE